MVLEKCPKKTETLGKDSCSKEEQKKARKRKKKSQSCRKSRYLPTAQQTISESFNQRETLGSQTLRTKTVYRFEYDPPHVKKDIMEEDCFSLFPLETLVYLTPDSEHALEDVDLNKVYILGGLVDESIQKKVTLQKAWEYSVRTARLPIQEYMVKCQNGKNYHSQILAINQGTAHTHNWPEALKKGVSSGKGYVLWNLVE
ncbi:tRNA methyltransferase 10 homolog B isoform X5 [Carlito syrichta]|uniref:tRNA (guanine(9)-N(1))-methyltransferase n=1 Tax=Carlito syrichta TaxID=1868482 RepID=A0A1U7UQ41_CARSF|nr:tRNA methyltransferase 10 homolog B isoform X5 [Carlito syrichta]